ncbi:zinc-ribbon domain-containing protein [Haloarchaeobius sp. HRN-SO-5]
MSRLPTLLKRLLARDETVTECRHCGTTVEPDTETCPSCGADEFSQYQIR